MGREKDVGVFNGECPIVIAFVVLLKSGLEAQIFIEGLVEFKVFKVMVVEFEYL